MANLKIATHDSATGEPGKWWAKILTPFARTQSKSIYQQYRAGCRLFDLRVRKFKGEWHFAHGPWVSENTVHAILSALYVLTNHGQEDTIHMSITYEGKNPDREELKKYYESLKNEYPEFDFCYLAIKYGDESSGTKVKYTYLEFSGIPANEQAFLPLNGSTWQTYLPIPWLWKKIYFNKPSFNEEKYRYVDFL